MLGIDASTIQRRARALNADARSSAPHLLAIVGRKALLHTAATNTSRWCDGKDTLVNNTSLTSLDYGYGGNHQFTVGTGFNYTYFFGNNNTDAAQAGVSDERKDHGSGDGTPSCLGNDPRDLAIIQFLTRLRLIPTSC